MLVPSEIHISPVSTSIVLPQEGPSRLGSPGKLALLAPAPVSLGIEPKSLRRRWLEMNDRATSPSEFVCSGCGATYEVTTTVFANPVEDYADCVLCGKLLAEWDSDHVPLFRLIRTPDGKSPREKPIA